MTTKTEVKGPSAHEQALDDVLSAVPVQDTMEGALSDSRVIEGKDGKPDIAATLEHLIEDGKDMVGKSVPAARADYTLIPGYDNLKAAFKSIRDGIKDGKYTNRLKSALVNLYENTVQEGVMTKALARIQAAPIETAKKASIALATLASDKYLISQIEQADSVAELIPYARRALQSLYTKARESFQIHGKVEPFREAYTFGK